MLFIFKSFLFFLVVDLVKSDDPYIPCQSYISFSYDDSNNLSGEQFRAQTIFIKSALGNLNHPERLRAEGGYGGEFNWNSGLSISQMQSSMNSAEQTSIPYSLLQQFSSLATSYENLKNFNGPIGALIFISDTSDSALRNADRLLPKLSGIQITFVLLGSNVDSSKLRSFSSNFLYWPDMSQPQPDNWQYISYHAYGCDSNSASSAPTKLPSTGTPPYYGPYTPCQRWITALIDTSNVLFSYQFNSQITFTKWVLAQVSHEERIRYGYYNGEQAEISYPWNPDNNQQTLRNAIDNTQQNTFYGSDLLQAMVLLVSSMNQNQSIPDATLIFVTDTTNQYSVTQALNVYNKSLKGRIGLTFFLLGSEAHASDLQGFADDATIFIWQNLDNSQPDGWDISQGFRCVPKQSSPVTAPLSTMTFSTPLLTFSTSVTQTIPLSTPRGSSGPYIPCRSWIHFGVDDSNQLNSNDNQIYLNFIASEIGKINHPERLEVSSVYDSQVLWNLSFSIQQIQGIVQGMQQSAGPYSLRNQFSNLIFGVSVIQPTTDPIAGVIFISDTSDSAIAGANEIFNILYGVQITFVLLGPNADSSKLTQFSNNFIFWTDLSQPQPDNWNNLFPPAYGCSIVTTIPPSTSPTTPSSYMPCPSWISFGVDDSDNLNNTQFSNQLNFLSSAIAKKNHLERVQVVSVYDQQVTWNSNFNLEQFQHAVNGITQAGPYFLKNEFSKLLISLNTIQPNIMPIGALIFISDTSDAALAGADQIFDQLAGARITFVLLGNGPDQSKLTKYSNNFITWRDLSQTQPDNWDVLSGTTYGCSNNLAPIPSAIKKALNFS